MRKNSPRKWLHAILDLLPVILIPVFMVYSHRHTIDSYSAQVEETNYLNVFQLIDNGLPTSFDNYVIEDGTGGFDNNSQSLYVYDDGTIYNEITFEIYSGHKYYFSYEVNTSGDLAFATSNFGNSSDFIIFEDVQLNTSTFTLYDYIVTCTDNDHAIPWYNFYDCTEVYFRKMQMFDLTATFGTGNEPSKEVFRDLLSGDYLSYGTHSLEYGTHFVIYDDTDIGSQFVYTLYNTTDKYFNFTNVFNLSSFTDWINTNLFNGAMPLMAYTVWYIMVYEFIIDLLFLFYAFFMFLIDFTESLLDKPFSKGRC